VLGDPVGTAQSTLIAAGFAKGNIGVTQTCDANGPVVYAQSVAGGRKAAVGSTIQLTARYADCVAYSNEIDQYAITALKALQSEGFTVSAPSCATSVTGAEPVVVAQAPGVGNGYLRTSTTVTLTCRPITIG
jgi:eukaryotic-like serine/threonine-protein kinase